MTDPTAPTGFLLVANAAAGSAEEEQVAAARAVLAVAAPVEVVASASPGDLDAALDRLDGRALVVAGGDGSLHLAVGRLHARDPARLATTSIGLVPLGTGNDFARGLGLPLDAVEAARRCAAGVPRRLDLLTTDSGDPGDVVVNASHAGVGAVAAERSADLKDRLGAAAYPLGALLAGVTDAGHDLTVTVDGAVVHAGPTLMVGVANAPFIGGGTELAPGAVPDDGLADVVVVTAVGPLARVAFAAALRHGGHLSRDDVAHHRGRVVRVAGDPVPHDLDGELLPARASLTHTVAPGAWRLLA